MDDNNNDMKTVLGAIAMALLVLIILAILVIVTIAFGYLIGVLVAMTPFISDWLTASLPISKAQIPGITSWLAVASLFIGGSKKVTETNTKEER